MDARLALSDPNAFCYQQLLVASAFSTPLLSLALFTSHANPKYFLFHPSHRIFRRIHGALNVGKKDN
jgi:hypothetical protein